jgi:hypothetical protein
VGLVWVLRSIMGAMSAVPAKKKAKRIHMKTENEKRCEDEKQGVDFGYGEYVFNIWLRQ